MTAGRISLLVVDDDEMNRDMLSRRLVRKGYEVAVAADGPCALRMIREGRFDLVLLDVMMPGMNGLEVLTEIRTTYHTTDLPVIMATARGESTDIVRALELGANDYVTKPLDFPVVLARVQTHLELKRTVDQVKQLEQSLEERNRQLEQTNTQLEAINGRMTRDLRAAARIQESFLPRELLPSPGTDFAWVYRPCDELAGDGLNVVPLGGGMVGLYILDVSGHGVASALLSVTMSRLLSAPTDPASILVRNGEGPDRGEITPPADVAARLNRLFPFDPATAQFSTLLYGVLDGSTGTFRYASAGHPGPVHLPAAGEPEMLDGRGFPIGVVDDGAFEERSVGLAPGGRLFLYSDGVTEAAAPTGLQFGDARLLESIARGRSRPLREGVDLVLADVERWQGSLQSRDDVSILAVEMTGPGADAGDSTR